MKSCCKPSLSQNSSAGNKELLSWYGVFTLPFIGLIKIYQWVISPMLGPKCRFVPTCSQYALQALTKYGVLKGTWLAAKRIVRCNPWGGHGYDPLN
jgi:putative membrane protein insertion efficiency factor